VDRAAERQRGARREVDGAAVENRQRPGQSETNGADMRVRRSAERGAATAEDLRKSRELGVDLEPDDRFVSNA
jgi:hypothetical protein